MKEQSYKKMLSAVSANNNIAKLIVWTGKFITYGVYAFYPLLVLYLAFFGRSLLVRVIAVPAVSFIAVSVVRHLLNMPRPYEKYDITPLYNKKTRGNSFPSRHTFSVFIIGFAALYVCLPLGIVVFALGVLLAVSRVLCGVHFIKDVVSGFVSAAACGVIGFYLI